MSSAKNINLFKHVEEKYEVEKRRYRILARVCMVLSVITCFVLFVIYAYQLNLFSQIDSIRAEQNQYESKINTQFQKQVELTNIAMRLDKIRDTQKKEVAYVATIQKLQSFFDQTGVATEIIMFTRDDFNRDPTGSFKARLAFADVPSQLQFLKRIEDDKVQKSIKLLTIESYTVDRIALGTVGQRPTLEIRGLLLK